MAVMDCVCLERGLSNQEEESPIIVCAPRAIIKMHHVIFQTSFTFVCGDGFRHSRPRICACRAWHL